MEKKPNLIINFVNEFNQQSFERLGYSQTGRGFVKDNKLIVPSVEYHEGVSPEEYKAYLEAKKIFILELFQELLEM